MQTGSSGSSGSVMAPSQNLQMSGGAWLAKLQRIGRQGKWQQVLQSLEEVPADVAPEVACSMAIVACGRSLRWQRCSELLWGQRGIFVPNMVVVGSTLGVLSKASKWKQADALLTWFWQSRAANTNHNSTVLYNCTIDSAALASKWQTARFLLNHSRLRSAQPDVVTYTSLIKTGEMTTQWKAAVSLLHGNLQSDLIVFNAAMSSCSKSSVWQQSQILLSHLSRAELESETISFNTVSSACEKAQQWTLAIQTFAHLRTISTEADVVSFSVAVQAASRKPSYGSEGTWQVSCKLLGELNAGQVQPDLVLLTAMTETEAWQLALILQQQHLCQAQRNILFNSAMSTCARRATWLRAQSILQNLKVQNQADVASYTSLIRSCTSGNWCYAHAVLEDLYWRRLKGDSIVCSASIKTCDAVGEWRRALLVLAAFQEKHVQPDIIVYNDSISACAKDAQWQQSQHFFLMLQLLGLDINNATLNTVLQAHDASGEWQKANHYFAMQHRQSVQADLVAFSTASALSERAGKQLSAAKLLSSVEAACESELKG